MQRPDYIQILHKYWGYDSFRSIQLDIIQSIGSGKDTLGLMPTGGGKSITFQVPALSQKGLCLVITPLIALMKDQVEKLRSMGIKATAIYSGMTRDYILAALENCIFGDYKFLYVSPERLQSELFITKLGHMHVSFITVDEAHCISQWGYDFRPSYLEIANIRKLLPYCPILALTATATPKVAADIQKQLGFSQDNIIRTSFERKNLAYIVQHTEDKPRELLNILKNNSGAAIVYTRNRDRTREAARWLNDNGISSIHYHAGLENTDKDLRQSFWQKGDIRVIVATNAFGMGIDKSDVRLVIHLDVPDSMEAYFQEAGRAGRDGKPAKAILLYNKSDSIQLRKRTNENFPSIEYIRNVYEDMACYYQLAVGDGYNVTYEFNESDFCQKFHYFPIQLESALGLLTRANYLLFRDKSDNQSRIIFLLGRDELYRLDRLSGQLDTLLKALLRLYSGLFSQYVTIEEKSLANATGFDSEQVYTLLKALNQQRILHYVPRKMVPHITYITRRVETSEIVLGKDIYQDRKADYEARIAAMLHYIESDNECRSRILLEYFGEWQKQDCGICDICRLRHHPDILRKEIEHAAEGIAQLLSDNKPHTFSELHALPFASDTLSQAMQWLMDDGEISLKQGFVYLN